MTFEILTVLVLLNLAATVSLWRGAARKPEKLKKKFLGALLHSEPITPKHQKPKSIGEKFGSFVRDTDRQFFADFADFARVVNWWFAESDIGGAWRLQELPETELELQFSDMPDYGRRYSIFCNQICVGTLEVSPDVLDYSAENPIVRTDIEIEWVRLMSLHTVRAFLDGIALHVSDTKPNTVEHLQREIYIDRALTEVVWQTQRIPEFEVDAEDYGQLELRLRGLARWYFVRERSPSLPQHG